MKDTFDFRKFKQNGSYANVLRNSKDETIGVCYSKTIDSAIAYFKRAYKLSGEYTIQSHIVYGWVHLAEGTYRELSFNN